MLEIQMIAFDDLNKNPNSSQFGKYGETSIENKDDLLILKHNSKKAYEQCKIVGKEIKRKLEEKLIDGEILYSKEDIFDLTSKEFIELRESTIDRYIVDHGI